MHKALVSRTQPKDGGDSFGGSITSTDTYSFKSPSKLGVNSIANCGGAMENADSSLIYFGPLENLAYCLPRPVYLSSPWRDDDR